MKNRILRNWTIVRVIYLALGVTVIIQAIMTKQWIGTLLGAYFASMGLFSFGCAAGNCTYNSNISKTDSAIDKQFNNIEFEEVK